MNLSGRMIVVTGGAGLIGSFLVEQLLACGAKVAAADDFSRGRREYLDGVGGRAELREGDLEHPDAMERALAGAEIVFHLASRVYGVGYSAGNHLAILEHNERITNNLIHVLARRPVTHLLVASSSCVYPDDGPDTIGEQPLFEGEPEAANWGYGWAKRMLEQKAVMLARETGTRLTIVRPFNIYGERYTWAGNDSQAIPMLVKKVMDGDEPVVVWGSGQQRRNYLHAIDCADAMAGLVAAGFTGAVNIGTEDTVTLMELAATICRLAGRRAHLVSDTSRPEGRRTKSSDASLLRRAYPDFRPRIGLEDGLTRMMGWYRANFGIKAA
jgi:nucleoside-diphosphate-sugar epimerase